MAGPRKGAGRTAANDSPRKKQDSNKCTPAENSVKPHLSPSQLGMFCRCPESWRRRYLENEIIPPGVSMLQGTGVHGGIEENGRQKIETHADLPASQIVEAAVASFEAGTHAGYGLSDDEASRGADIVLGEAKDTVSRLAKLYADEIAADYQPIAVEHEARIALPGAHDLLGYIDLIDDKHRVVDYKTSRKKKQEAEAHSSLQLTFYAAAVRREFGKAVPAVRLEVLVDTKTPSRQILESERDNRDFAVLAATVNAVEHAIASGSFPPNTSGWQCNPSYCGFFNSCKFVNAHRVYSIG